MKQKKMNNPKKELNKWKIVKLQEKTKNPKINKRKQKTNKMENLVMK
jgi:hypothetical protein